ncbi:AAA family ATPase [Actinoplanes sp. NPDC000266]
MSINGFLSLVGREKELVAIAEFVRQARSSGGLLYVYGDAGLGKSALLNTAAREASAVGLRVLQAIGVASERDVHFAGLHQVIHSLAAFLPDLSQRHQGALSVVFGVGAGPVTPVTVIAEATLALVRHAAASRPLLIVIDEFPLLDQSSVSVLRNLPLDGSGVGMLLAGSAEQLQQLADGTLRYELLPLAAEAAAELLARNFPMLAPPTRLRVLAESAGNPLALLELPTALSSAQLSGIDPLPDFFLLTPRLRSAFVPRVAALAPSTRRLLLIAALEGSGDMVLLRSAFGDQSFREDLRRAEDARLVDIDAITGRLVFHHPLTRSAVAELATDGEHRREHEILARHLIGNPERHVWHLARATAEPDEEVAVALEQMAHRRRRSGDVAGAVTALTRAATLSPGPADRKRRLAGAAYLGADVTGRLLEVPRLLDAAHDDSPAEPIPLATAVAIAHHMLLSGEGDVDSAYRVLIGAVERYTGDESMSREVLVEGLYTLVWICFFAGREELWEPFEEAFTRLTDLAPESLSLLKACFGDPVRQALPMLDRLDRAVSRLTAATDPVEVIRISMASGYVDRLLGCRAALQRVFEQGRDGNNITLQIHASNLLSRYAYEVGDWDEVVHLAETALHLSEQFGYRLLALTFRHRLALVAAAQGRHELAEKLANEILQFAAPRRIQIFTTLGAQIKILAALGRGEAEEAYLQATSIIRAGTLPGHNATVVWMLLDVAEAAVRADRRDEALALADALRQAEVAALSSRLALVTFGVAGMAAADGQYATWFEQALSVPGAEVWAFDRARIQLHYGERLRRAKVTVAARQNLTAALGTFQRLGATPWENRTRSELRASGLADDNTDLAILADLTPQQREIVLLAASGLTNKQIGERLRLSPRTVGSHLYQAFPKLGVTSRAALRDAVRRDMDE